MTSDEHWSVLDRIYNDDLDPNVDTPLGNLILKNYVNLNATGSGLAAYAFEDNEHNTYFAFRGTEGSQEGAPFWQERFTKYFTIDWLNDIAMGTLGYAPQLDAAVEFVEDTLRTQEPGHATYVTGQSLGGALTLYVAA